MTTSSGSLAEWHMGWIPLQEAVARGRIRIDGPPRLLRAFASWGGQSPFAKVRAMRTISAG